MLSLCALLESCVLYRLLRSLGSKGSIVGEDNLQKLHLLSPFPCVSLIQLVYLMVCERNWSLSFELKE